MNMKGIRWPRCNASDDGPCVHQHACISKNRWDYRRRRQYHRRCTRRCRAGRRALRLLLLTPIWRVLIGHSCAVTYDVQCQTVGSVGPTHARTPMHRPESQLVWGGAGISIWTTGCAELSRVLNECWKSLWQAGAHPPRVQVEALPLLMRVQDLRHVPVSEEDPSPQERVRAHARHPLYPALSAPRWFYLHAAVNRDRTHKNAFIAVRCRWTRTWPPALRPVATRRTARHRVHLRA